MADLKLNPILERLSGKVGDLVFRRYKDRVILARTPQRTSEPTQAQQAHRERFREAVVYGRTAMADPTARALYEEAANDKEQPIFSVVFADFFNTPTVDEIDVSGYTGAAGEFIRIRASDDFEVASVEVILSDTGGNEIERGDAALDSEGRWAYEATTDVGAGTTVRISATATDRPGGTGTDQLETIV